MSLPCPISEQAPPTLPVYWHERCWGSLEESWWWLIDRALALHILLEVCDLNSSHSWEANEEFSCHFRHFVVGSMKYQEIGRLNQARQNSQKFIFLGSVEDAEP